MARPQKTLKPQNIISKAICFENRKYTTNEMNNNLAEATR